VAGGEGGLRGGIPPAQGEIIQELPPFLDTGELRQVNEQRAPGAIRRWGELDSAGIGKSVRNLTSSAQQRLDQFVLLREYVPHHFALNDFELPVSLKQIEQG